VAETGEAFGVAPIEAMAYGCAPLVSNLACFRDFIEDGVTASSLIRGRSSLRKNSPAVWRIC
jgi:glycogen synthase